MSMNIRFAGGKVVEAETKGFVIRTDAPTKPGGPVTAPSPVDLLLASLGNCTSYYVLHFCESRGLPTDDVSLSVDVERDEETRRITDIQVSINLPTSFPEKYQEAILKAASQCTVKKYMQASPHLVTRISQPD